VFASFVFARMVMAPAEPGVCVCAGVCAGLSIATPAPAATGIGSVTKLDRSVTGAISGRPFPVSFGDDVREDETLRTDGRGEARLTLVDDTNLVIFSRSSVKLDRFILESPDRARSVIVSTSDGTFAFDTGHSPHEAYRIDTSAGTLSPHGTRFTFALHGGRLKLDVQEGAVMFCPRGESEAYCVVARPGRSVLGSAGAAARVVVANVGTPDQGSPPPAIIPSFRPPVGIPFNVPGLGSGGPSGPTWGGPSGHRRTWGGPSGPTWGGHSGPTLSGPPASLSPERTSFVEGRYAIPKSAPTTRQNGFRQRP